MRAASKRRVQDVEVHEATVGARRARVAPPILQLLPAPPPAPTSQSKLHIWWTLFFDGGS